MRILHVIAGPKSGGADPLTLDAVLALSNAGIEQQVVIRKEHKADASLLADAGLVVTRADFDKTWREPTKAVIRAAAEKLRADIVQYWLGRAALFAPKSLSTRSVGWHSGFHRLARFKNCDWHMAASADVAERLLTEGAPAERVGVVAPFAELPAAAPADRAALATPDGAPVLLALTRPNGKKGFDALIEAVARLPGVFLWVLGETDSEEDLRALAKSAGITERMRLLGRRADRAALFAACDAVALPARLEPFGRAAAEAWAADRPLLAAEAAATTVGARDEVDALIAVRDDAKALAAQITRLLDDAEFARRLIENGARAYEAKYTRPAFVRASMAFYERVRQSAQTQERKPAA